MPAMSLFGVAWGWSSDDFCCPGVALLLIRAGWIAALGTALVALAPVGECGAEDGATSALLNSVDPIVPWADTGEECPVGLLRSYARAMVVLELAEVLVEALGVAVSLRGSVMDPTNRRWCMPPLVYLHATLSTIELLGAVLGAQLAFKNDADDAQFEDLLLQRCGCGGGAGSGSSSLQLSWAEDAAESMETAILTLRSVAVTMCVLSCFVACGVCCTHHSEGRKSGSDFEGMGGRNGEGNLNHRLSRAVKSKKLKCCLDDFHFPELPGTDLGLEGSPIGVLARILSSFFRGISRNDFVASDVVAAVLLVGVSQKQKVLHPVLEAAKVALFLKERADTEQHLSLGVVVKLGARGAKAKEAVRKRHGGSPAALPKSPMSAMAFAAFEGVRPESEHAPPHPLSAKERLEVVGTARHYMTFALGSYGWMLYAYLLRGMNVYAIQILQFTHALGSMYDMCTPRSRYRRGGRCFSCAPCAIGTLCPCCGSPNVQSAACHGSGVGFKDDNCCRFNQNALLYVHRQSSTSCL